MKCNCKKEIEEKLLGQEINGKKIIKAEIISYALVGNNLVL